MDDRGYEQRAEVLQGIRRALEKTKHYEKFTKRVTNAVQEELPWHTVYMQKAINSMGLDGIRVWGNGIHYDNGINLSWNPSRSWVEALDRELDIADFSDYQERAKMEERMIPGLEDLERQVAKLQEEALDRFRQLPIPKSAKARAEAHYWDEPSFEIRQLFPKLFP